METSNSSLIIILMEERTKKKKKKRILGAAAASMRWTSVGRATGRAGTITRSALTTDERPQLAAGEGTDQRTNAQYIQLYPSTDRQTDTHMERKGYS